MRGMKLGVFSVMTMLALTVFTCIVLAQQGTSDKPTAAPGVSASPGTGDMGMPATPTTQPGAAGAAAPGMGVRGAMITPEERRQGQILLKSPMYLDSASGLLAQADKLNLSEDQKNKLKDIQRNERNQARQVLNDQQRQQLTGLSEQPVALMDMHNKLHARMMQQMQGRGGLGATPSAGTGAAVQPRMVCPLMELMEESGMQRPGMTPGMTPTPTPAPGGTTPGGTTPTPGATTPPPSGTTPGLGGPTDSSSPNWKDPNKPWNQGTGQ